MKESTIEWDVKLWTYVLYYKGKPYPLYVDNIRHAHDRGSLKLDYLKRIEAENGNDSNSTL
jgi:hypothetical protein